MAHSIENRTFRASDLTEEELENLIEALLENPLDTIVASCDDESTTIYFGVQELEGRYVAISYDDGESSPTPLAFGEHFETEEEAEAEAMEWARKTRTNLDGVYDSHADEAWDRLPDASEELVGPFTFRDNADYASGHEMEDLDDVFAFFGHEETLFEPESWGNHYSCSLLDANGVAFWVFRNSEGSMKAYKA